MSDFLINPFSVIPGIPTVTGFGTKYSNPSTLPTGIGTQATMTNLDDAVVLGSAATPFGLGYPWDNATGFGTKFANPTGTNTGFNWQGVAFNQASSAIGAVIYNVPTFARHSPHVWAWSSSTGFGTKYTAPAVVSQYFSIQFDPTDSVIFCTLDLSSSNLVEAYAWNNSTGFGTKYASMTALSGRSQSSDVNAANNAVLVANVTSNRIQAVSWSTSTGWGSTYSQPATPQSVSVFDVAFTSNDSAALFANGDNIVGAYTWNNSTGFGTLYTSPGVLPNQPPSLGISTGDNAAAFGDNLTPFIHMYAWNNATGFGSKFANPSSLPAGTSNKLKISKANNAIVMGTAVSPWITAYKLTN